MSRLAGGTAPRIRRRPSLESRWQEWVSQPLTPVASSGAPPTHEAIAKFAYALWEQRGHPWGEAEQDWYRAERELFERSARNDTEN